MLSSRTINPISIRKVSIAPHSRPFDMDARTSDVTLIFKVMTGIDAPEWICTRSDKAGKMHTTDIFTTRGANELTPFVATLTLGTENGVISNCNNYWHMSNSLHVRSLGRSDIADRELEVLASHLMYSNGMEYPMEYQNRSQINAMLRPMTSGYVHYHCCSKHLIESISNAVQNKLINHNALKVSYHADSIHTSIASDGSLFGISWWGNGASVGESVTYAWTAASSSIYPFQTYSIDHWYT